MYALANQTQPNNSSGGRLVTVDGRELPLQSAALSARATGGIARTVLEQRYRNPFAEPLHVTYTMPLPADGAVSGFAFRIGEERIVGEVDRKAAARERFEQALIEGHTAAILDQERSSLFKQEVGNIPPGEEVVVELTVDQKLAWLPEGSWEWRFPTVAAPRYLGAEGRVADAANVTVDVNSKPLPVRASLKLEIEDRLAEGRRPESPSHPLRSLAGLNSTEVALADDQGARLDRDLVVRWPVAQPKVGLQLATFRADEKKPIAGSAYGLLTFVPPSPDAKPETVSRDLIVLLDTSGSMGGEPLAQARKVVAALVQTLGERDQLELIEFSDVPRRWRKGATPMKEKMRKDALDWLAKLRASGGTEMRSGISAALQPLRPESQRQVVLVSDGLIGFESEVISEILGRLPAGCRLHTVGVGSSVNRTLTASAARAGRGTEVVIGIGEDPERAAQRLCARTAAPVLVDVELSGSALRACAPAKLPDLFGGAPALVSLQLSPEGGELVVTGRTADGTFQQRLQVEPSSCGAGSAALSALFAREAVEDLELRIHAGQERRTNEREIERLGLEHQISTRLTSWVAVSASKTVDPGAPTRHSNVPQELPYGASMEGFGLRSCAPVMAAPAPMAQASAPMKPMARRRAAAMPPAPGAAPKSSGVLGGIAQSVKGMFGGGGGEDDADGGFPEPESSAAPVYEGFSERAKKKESREEEKAAGGYFPEPRDLASEADAEEMAESLEQAKADSLAAVLELLGRIALAKDGLLVIEVELSSPLALELPPSVTVVWSERTLVAEVDSSRSTHPGSYSAGHRVRIALKLPAGAPGSRPERLELVCGMVRLKVKVA